MTFIWGKRRLTLPFLFLLLICIKHICADTLRSAAVLIAAGISFIFDSVSSAQADSAAAIAVSVTILVSLIPLLRGLFVTARQIVRESRKKSAFTVET